MWKVTVKRDGAVTNQKDDCADEAEANAWIADQEAAAAFGPEGYVIEKTDITAQAAAAAEKLEALAYLESTQVYWNRLQEAGTSMPDGMSALRLAAWAKVI